eukprot:scaffold4.g4748.t1
MRGKFGAADAGRDLRRAARGRCRASAQAEKLLSEGQAKYAAGERVAALGLFEKALNESPTPEQRLAAQFNAACVHACYGDVELAQISLKDAMFGGLDIAQALAGEQPGLVRMQASAQVLNQLRRFADQVQRNIATNQVAAAVPQPGMGAAPASAASGRGKLLGSDISEALQTDVVGIDSSLLGMVRRVAVLLLALSGLGAVLFFLGLKYAFPEAQ